MTEWEKKQVNLSDGTRVLLFAVAANLLMQLLLGIVQGIVLRQTGRDIIKSDYFQLATMLLLQAAFFVVPLTYYGAVQKKAPVLRMPLKAQPRAAFGVVLAPLTILAFYLPTQLFTIALDKMGYAFAAGVNLDTAGKIVLGLFAMVIVAPFVEELIFRGFLLSGLCDAFKKWGAALLSGLAFSLMHMNPEQTVYQFFLGVVCALAALESGSILSAMAVHATSNLLAVLLQVTPLGSAAFYRFTNFILKRAWSAALGVVVSAAVFGGLILLVLRAMRSKEEPSLLRSETAVKTNMIPYIVTVAMCAVMWAFVFGSSV